MDSPLRTLLSALLADVCGCMMTSRFDVSAKLPPAVLNAEQVLAKRHNIPQSFAAEIPCARHLRRTAGSFLLIAYAPLLVLATHSSCGLQCACIETLKTGSDTSGPCSSRGCMIVRPHVHRSSMRLRLFRCAQGGVRPFSLVTKKSTPLLIVVCWWRTPLRCQAADVLPYWCSLTGCTFPCEVC